LQWSDRLIDMFVADMNGREIFPSNLAKNNFVFSMEEEQILLTHDSLDNNRSLMILESTIPSGGNGTFHTAHHSQEGCDHR
jgi:hypothetical protein